MSAIVRDTLARHAPAALATAALLLATMLAGIGLLGVSGAFLTGAALSFGVLGGYNLFLPSAGIRALTLARIVCRYGEKIVGHAATLRIARDLRVALFARLLALSPAQLAGLRGGDVLARLLGDVDAVDGLLVRALAPLLALAAAALALIGWAARLDPVSGAWIAGTSLIAAALASWRAAAGRQRSEAALARKRAGLRASLHELYDGAADLAAMDATARWLQRLPLEAAQLGQRERRQRLRAADATAMLGAAGAIGWTGLLWLACDAALAGRVSPAQAAGLAFAALALSELTPALALAWQALQGARASAHRIGAVAGQVPVVAEPRRPQPLPASGELLLDAVVFAWPGGRRVLDRATLRLAPGERVAIRGDSGVGKSSLAALVLRAVDPAAGALRWSGVDLREAALSDWHARLAWLPQEAPVFAGTLADNLRLGNPAADDARMREALACVQLAPWVEAVGGLSCWIGEGGTTVSAGQARRIALARALLRDAPLLVLDEPTEGLDQDTADAVMRGVAQWCTGRSVLVISHARLPAGVVDRELLLRDGTLYPAA